MTSIQYLDKFQIDKDVSLVVIDIQNDFCKNGALEVPNGDSIINGINKLMQYMNKNGNPVILTQDWHPVGHKSFASSHEGKNPFDPIDDNPGIGPVLWPDHCVQNSKGANFHKDLKTEFAHLVIRKGYRKEIDSYSGFLENDKETKTGLEGYLNGLNIKKILVVGLALDFCVYYSAKDAKSFGFDVTVVEDLTKGIATDSIAAAIKDMVSAGISFVKLKSIQ